MCVAARKCNLMITLYGQAKRASLLKSLLLRKHSVVSGAIYLLINYQTSNRNSSSECTRRIGLAAGVMKHLDRIWNQQNLTMSTKIRIYSTCVLAVLNCGSETWTLTQADWKRLDSFHTRCQRRILHTRWYDFVSNNEVLFRTCLLAASSIVRKRRLGLFGHVARLTESQQTRSFGLAAKPKTVPDHILIGNALVVDLPLPGSIRSAGTQEYQ